MWKKLRLLRRLLKFLRKSKGTWGRGLVFTEIACTEENGKWAPVYQNGYNNHFYFRCDYE